MLKKVLFASHPTPFTSHYIIQCKLNKPDHSFNTTRFFTVHRCPCCGFSEFVLWDLGDAFPIKHGELLSPSASSFGFRSVNGTKYFQSYCKKCR